MKIGIVCYPTFGGSGVVATELGKALADKGHKVHFISYRQPARLDRFHANISYHEVNISDYPLFDYPPYDTALASKIVDVVRYEQLDILHVHYAIPHATVAYLAKKILLSENVYIPVVTTLHGTDITLVGQNASFAPVVQFGINKSDGVTAVSEWLRRETLDNFKITREIRTIPNFIDFSRFKKSNKDHFRKAIAPNDEKILIHTSNFRKVKRIEDAVMVFKYVREQMPAKLLLVGDGPDRESVEQLCREHNLYADVRFLGKQDAIEELLAVADLFLMPSASESFGLAALEAMACEVPVISSNVGGIPEVNIQGVTGYLSDIGNVREMADNAIRLLSDDALLMQFRAAALAQARTFDLIHILPEYEAFYEEVISNHVWQRNAEGRE